jgi:prepilin-type N-terminal cleavage/methylation domain-containing protein
MKTNTRNTRGFTLIELLIVIALLGILVVAGISSFNTSFRKSRDAKRKNDLRQIGLALELYSNDRGRYPAASTDGQGLIEGCIDYQTDCVWGGVFTNTNADSTKTVYMPLLPADSTPSQRYFYHTDAGGTYFQLYARIENTLDSDIPKNAQNKPRIFSDMNCGTASATVPCNYGVSSQNKPVTEDQTIGYEE